MYVCNCNGVTDREVDEAVAAGARCPRSVLAHHGAAPCCGRCLPEIEDVIAGATGGCAQKESLVAAE
jgi:bacterioferritin-associated ferredoxin